VAAGKEELVIVNTVDAGSALHENPPRESIGSRINAANCTVFFMGFASRKATALIDEAANSTTEV
jgi:hypothetical protein